ncbi:MAG: nucleotidyl transferase AbiEii/AbiGii toxin family protein [Candidatus Sericytochromatia bacterium]
MTKNPAASVRARLLNLAHQRSENFNHLMTRYMLERLLYRLGVSSFQDQFVLKGAMLFSIWSNKSHRPTKDLDLLGYGEPSIERLVSVFQEICRIQIADDGVVFLPDSITGSRIKEDQDYEGVRLHIEARLEAARNRLQLDIGFGDAVLRPLKQADYQPLLDFPVPQISIYPPESSIAEKFHALATLGMANSRMKDFYDLWILAGLFQYDSRRLGEAIRLTFAGRGTALPAERPLALTETFFADPQKQLQWKAFLKKSGLDQTLDLETVVEKINQWLWPLFEQLTE